MMWPILRRNSPVRPTLTPAAHPPWPTGPPHGPPHTTNRTLDSAGAMTDIGHNDPNAKGMFQ